MHGAIISACGIGKQWQRALQLFEEMQARGTEADVITYNATISACEKAGKERPVVVAAATAAVAP